MTKENAKRAYEIAIKQGNTKIAENILIRHPEFKQTIKKTISKEKGE